MSERMEDHRTTAAATPEPGLEVGPGDCLPSPDSPPPDPGPAPRARRRAFTLVELLVVVGIMGLLLGVTVTAFDTIGKGAKMRSALMDLKSSLSLARQYAITDRRAVFVVFPDKYTGISPDIPAHTNEVYPARYQSYYIMNREHRSTNLGAGSFSWQYHYNLGRWRHLPKGIIFDRDQEPPPDLEALRYVNIFRRPLGGEPTYSNNIHCLPFPGMTNSDRYYVFTQQVVALAFSANGRLVQNVKSVRWVPMVVLTEGAVETDSTGVEKIYLPHEVASKFAIEILPLTGRIRIREFYVQ